MDMCACINTQECILSYATLALKIKRIENLQFKEDHTMSRKSKFVRLSPWKARVKGKIIALQFKYKSRNSI